MILDFPDHDTLRLALTSGVVPEDVHTATASVGGDDEGRVYVETDVTLTRPVRKDLKRLGVTGKRSWPRGVARRDVASWVWAFPLERSGLNRFDDRTPVLFEIEDVALLPEIVGEILRLGNDRQAFRYVGDDEDERVLLRVVGPPYYSLLRAFEGNGTRTAPRAYVERSSRVWVEAGWDHPFASRLEASPGRVLLSSAADGWRTLDEAPFRDVYEILDFALPNIEADLEDRELADRLTVPLRLTRGGPSEGGELWVLDDHGIDQLDEFVRTSRDTLLERLAFAVGERDGERIVVLRIRPGKGAPPVLVLDGLACRPYLKLPNLFLPTGTRLHPPLRRDTVKDLLAADDALVTWLSPDPGNDGRPVGFETFRIADSAFRPLTDWVDYVLDRAHEPLESWMRSASFDFERFVCPEEAADRRRRERERAETDSGKKGKGDEPAKRSTRKPRERPDGDGRKFEIRREVEPIARVEKPAERRALEERLREVEKEFLASDVAAESAERLDAWREMAGLNTALGHHSDAAVCWTQSLWEDAEPDPAAVTEWYAAERASGSVASNRSPEPLTTDELDELMTAPSPAPSQVQSLAAHLARVVAEGERPAELVERLPEFQRFLDRHDGALSVRGGWFAARALFHLTDGDVLALARARDRVLERLFEHGLRPDRDLPSFLRGSGLRAGDRFRSVRERVVELHEAAREWSERNLGALGAKTTLHYIDVIFGFGLARLGEAERAREILENVQIELHETDAIHGWLVAAYGHRVEQAVAGKPTSTPLPEELLTDLEAAFSPSDEEREQLGPNKLAELEKALKLDRYKVDRMRSASRILEPHEKIDPYRRYNKGFRDDLELELVELSECVDRGELIEKVSGLLSREMNRDDRVRTLTTLLQVGPRVGEGLSETMLLETLPLLPEVPDVVRRALLLERGLYLAAHFDRRDDLAEFVERLHALLESQANADLDTLKSLHSLLSESFRGLRRLGMRDEIARLLERLEALVAGLALPKSKSRAANVAEWNKTVVESSRMQLQVAAGWFYFHQNDRAWPILDRVRKTVFETDLMPVHRTSLLCAYLSALGHAPVDDAVPRMLNVFEALDGVHDSYTTNTHYSVSQLNVAEATVLSMVGDDMILDPGARRWLDEDEYLVRRRIHADVRAAMAEEA